MENKKPYMLLPRYIKKKGLSLHEKGLLVSLCLEAVYYWKNPDFGIVKRSYKYLYEKFGISKPTFSKYISCLVEKGLIETVEYQNENRIKIINMEDFQADNRKSSDYKDKEMVGWLDERIK